MSGISSQGEKTQKATPKRRQEERKKGNIFQSRDITSAIGLIIIFLFLKAVSPYFFQHIKNIMIKYLSISGTISDFSIAGARNFMSDFAINTVILSASFLIVTSIIAIGIGFAQTRFNFAPSRLKPNFSKLNPLKGLKNLITLKTLIELTKSGLKIIIICIIVYSEVKANMNGFMSLFYKDIVQALGWIANTIFYIAVKVGAVMIVFGVLDFLYQWWEYERQIKMSVQEVKDEYKQTEGDPKVKGRQKELQRRMSMIRISQKVPLADVVIRNPTHFAVAIKYDIKKDAAPIVIAKGQDYLALKIIEIAQKNDITVTENKPLARGLYQAVEIDQQIPQEYYQAVAEILAFVYSLKKEKNRI